MKENITMEELVNLCKQYGIIFQGSENMEGLQILGTLDLLEQN